MKKLLLIFLLITSQMKASHYIGSYFYWKFLGNGLYEIHFVAFRDCAGIAFPTNPVIQFKSTSCNQSFQLLFNQISDVQITSDCYEGITTCNHGSAYGAERHEYTDTVTLAQCNDWNITFDLCCRNAAITNINNPSINNAHVFALLNNLNGDYSSPTFTDDPVILLCIDSSVCINNGTVGGDSVVYSLIAPKQSSTLNVVFINPFTFADPITSSTGVNFNSNTGDICIKPSQQEIDVMACLVSNYHNGILISEQERDMQVVSHVCNCQPQTNLPVSLIDFLATYDHGDIDLRWTTASEENNDSFYLYKFNAGWNLIGGVKGERQSDELINYSFSYPAIEGESVFMLRQKDYDGKVTVLGYARIYCIYDPTTNGMRISGSLYNILGAGRYTLLGQND